METIHLAALFHDVDHSGGKLKDSENIILAKTAFGKFASQEKLDSNIISEVENLINATEFPYTIPNSNISKFQTIIRDADMMQAFEYNWISQTTLGLASEFGLTVQDFIPKQRAFLEHIIFLTKTAEKFKKSQWSKVMNEFRILEVSMS